jgi:hypothetical protein
MCDLGLNVSGGMSPQRDDFSAKAGAHAMSIGDLIAESFQSDRSTSAAGLTDEIEVRRS